MTTRSTPRKRTPAVVIEAVPVAAVASVAAIAVMAPAPAPAVAKVSTLSAINEVMMVPTYLALALVFVPVNWLTGRYSR